MHAFSIKKKTSQTLDITKNHYHSSTLPNPTPFWQIFRINLLILKLTHSSPKKKYDLHLRQCKWAKFFRAPSDVWIIWFSADKKRECWVGKRKIKPELCGIYVDGWRETSWELGSTSQGHHPDFCLLDERKREKGKVNNCSGGESFNFCSLVFLCCFITFTHTQTRTHWLWQTEVNFWESCESFCEIFANSSARWHFCVMSNEG